MIMLGKGGPRLHGKRGSPEYIASYNEAIAQRSPVTAGILLAILNAYQASADFTGLAPRRLHRQDQAD